MYLILKWPPIDKGKNNDKESHNAQKKDIPIHRIELSKSGGNGQAYRTRPNVEKYLKQDE